MVSNKEIKRQTNRRKYKRKHKRKHQRKQTKRRNYNGGSKTIPTAVRYDTYEQSMNEEKLLQNNNNYLTGGDSHLSSSDPCGPMIVPMGTNINHETAVAIASAEQQTNCSNATLGGRKSKSKRKTKSNKRKSNKRKSNKK